MWKRYGCCPASFQSRDKCGIPEPKDLKPTLQALCKQSGLPTKCNEEVIIKGWTNKPKGLFQVLFERGWLNPDMLHLYIGDKEGNLKVSHHTDPTESMFSIDSMMKLQKNFMNKITLVQLHAPKTRYLHRLQSKMSLWVGRGGNRLSLGLGKVVL